MSWGEGLIRWNQNATTTTMGRLAPDTGAGATATGNQQLVGQYHQLGSTAIGSATKTAGDWFSGLSGFSDNLNAALSGGTRGTQDALFVGKQSGASLSESARNVSGYAGATAQSAGKLSALGDTLTRDAAMLRGEAQPWLQQGGDMLGMKPTTGMGAEWQRLYDSMSPDALTSFATTSTAQSADAARGETIRTLTRMGVSPGSGAMTESLARIKKAEQALLSSVKTQAHVLGLDKQREALAQGLSMALSMSGFGANLMSGATTATQAATQAEQAAGGAMASAGSLESTSGQLHQAAGQLAISLGNMNQDSARTAIQAFAAQTGAGQKAVNALVNATHIAAQYYSTQASSLLGLLQRNPAGNYSGLAV